MSGVLIYSEREDLALELLSGGRDLAAAHGGPLSVALLGDGQAAWADACFAHGAATAYTAPLDAPQPDTLAAALAQIATEAGAALVLMGSTRRGRTLAPRVAQLLGAGCVTDASHLALRDGQVITWRLALGGNTLKEETITTPLGVIAVSPGTFEAAPGGDGGEIVALSVELTPSRATTVERKAKESGAVDVERAPRLVCMGRGLQSRDDIPIVEALAAALGAEVVGTRPLAYELDWVAEDRMVGISGKTVSPDLYLAVGVSGQIQHTVSIRDSRIIVAINKDKNAPIFEMADYGIVGDLYEVVPRLTEALQGG